MKKNIALVVVGLPVDGPFDYSIPEEFKENICVGQRVSVLFNRKKRVGYIVGFLEKSQYPRLNPILSVLDGAPALDQKLLKLSKDFSEHYACAWGEAIETFLPPYLRKFAVTNLTVSHQKVKKNVEPQEILLQHLSFDAQWPKINEYVQKILQDGQSVLFLVPEYFLIEEVKKRLDESLKTKLIAFDETLTDKQAFELWQKAQAAPVSFVIGTRSAVFLPVNSLGLIVVYQEEDQGYKQEQSPAYHVSEVVRMRSKEEGSLVLWTSFLPSVELWQKLGQLNLEKFLVEDKKLAVVQPIDMTNYNPGKTSLLSFPLQNQIGLGLAQKQKIVILFNRRGFSTMTVCNQCGHSLKCPDCNVHLTFMYSKKKLACRHCAYTCDLPKICPACKGHYVRSLGTGLEKLEGELSRYYPQAKVCLVDKETKEFNPYFDICIATQAIIRYIENLDAHLYAVIDLDSMLNRSDFRSSARTLALLVKLRIAAKEKLLIQTRLKDESILKTLTQNAWEEFYQRELEERKELNLPPFAQVVSIHLRAADEEMAFEETKRLFNKLQEANIKDMDVSDPYAESVAKLRGNYRYAVLIKTKKIKIILPIIKEVLKDFKKKSKVMISINIDP